MDELPIPDELTKDSQAREVARVWVSRGRPTFVLQPNVWKDPGAWGILLADFARHVAEADSQGARMEKAEVLRRVFAALDAERAVPTDTE